VPGAMELAAAAPSGPHPAAPRLSSASAPAATAPFA
jgi:hypothetical protein